MNIRELLITVLQDKYTGVGAVPNVAAAIAADARFNIWVLTFAKKNASEQQMIELVGRYEGIAEQCSAIAKSFREDYHLADLIRGVDEITKQLIEAMKLP